MRALPQTLHQILPPLLLLRCCNCLLQLLLQMQLNCRLMLLLLLLLQEGLLLLPDAPALQTAAL
jgi:hypothetical protein